MLEIPLAKLAYIVLKARAFDAKVDPVEPDPGSNPTDDPRIILGDLPDDATERELTAALRRLSPAPEETRQPVPVGRRTAPAAVSPGLAGELRRLLAEIDAGR